MKPLLFALLACGGCTTAAYVKPIAALPVPRIEARAAPGAGSVAVGPFVDGRGDQFGTRRRSPLALVFHRSSEIDYPDAAGVLQGHDHGTFLTVGSLDGALPVLVARTLQQAGVAATVALQPGSADYYVTGRLVRSSLRRDSIPLAAALAPLGVPFKLSRYDFVCELALYDARAPQQPIFTRSYQFRDRRVSGLYYNRDAAYRLFTDGLDATLRQAARDLTQAIEAAGARAAAARPAG
jgi:hypothetical protein